jgi:nucleotide-binding universal stress UspA family protein
MPKFLVPMDESDASRRALAFAVDLANGAEHSEIHALYVHPPVDVAGKVGIFVTAERMRELAAEQSHWILDGIRDRLGNTSVAHTVELCEGDPAQTIARRAQERGCDAIVMGTRGMGRMANLVMGSVATQVVHLTHLPVILVK